MGLAGCCRCCSPAARPALPARHRPASRSWARAGRRPGRAGAGRAHHHTRSGQHAFCDPTAAHRDVGAVPARVPGALANLTAVVTTGRQQGTVDHQAEELVEELIGKGKLRSRRPPRSTRRPPSWPRRYVTCSAVSFTSTPSCMNALAHPSPPSRSRSCSPTWASPRATAGRIQATTIPTARATATLTAARGSA
jgi:hypothetical protein